MQRNGLDDPCVLLVVGLEPRTSRLVGEPSTIELRRKVKPFRVPWWTRVAYMKEPTAGMKGPRAPRGVQPGAAVVAVATTRGAAWGVFAWPRRNPNARPRKAM